MADQLPPDVICNIFSRLSIKSLAGIRCVCKSWLRYINGPYLETIYHVTEEPTPIMFQRLPNSLQSNKKKLCQISFLRVTQGTMTVKTDPVLEFGYKAWSLILGSCKGLTLVCSKKVPRHGTFLELINPLTKQRYGLPPIKVRTTHSHWFGSGAAAGVGFDDSTNTLTTVCVIVKELVWSPDIDVVREQLCTMVHRSGMSSWRELAQNPAYPISGEGVFANGRLHWLATCHDFWSPKKIVWFDVKTAEFGLTDFPSKQQLSHWFIYDHYCQLVDLNGELGFAYRYNFMQHLCLLELWILKQEEWVLHSMINSFLLYLNPRPYNVGMWPNNVVVSGCWNNAGDILLTSDEGKRLFVYTLQTRDLKEVYRNYPYCEADIRMCPISLFSIHGINPSTY